MDPLVGAGLKAAGKYVLGRVSGQVRAAMTRHTDDLLAAYKRDAEDWRLQRILALDKQYADLEGQVEDLNAKLDEMFADRQFIRLYDGIEAQALLEALDERREMLAALGAGIIDPRLSLEERVDVERVVRTLAPVDVMTLYGLSQVRGRTDTDGTRCGDTQTLVTRVLERSNRKGKLAACLEDRIVGGVIGAGASRTYSISLLGQQVLQVLRCYTEGKAVPFPIPGREPIPVEQAEAAWHAVGQLDGLKAFLDLAKAEQKRRGRIGMQYCQGKDVKPKINVNVFTAEMRAGVAALNGVSRAGIDVTVTERNEHGFFVVYVEGEDAILRVLADHIDAIFEF